MNKTPKLRFKEFSGDWESKKLGSLLEFKNGINASKEQYGHGKKFINVLDILSNDYITYENIIGKVDVDDATFDKYSVGYGDVVFQRSSETREEVGTANVYLDKENKATFGGFIIRGKKVGEYNPIFMNKLLKTSSSRKEITTKSGGSTRYNVGQETLSDVEVMFPKLEEQEKIASFFSLIDDKVSLQGDKVEALKDYKRGMMQKIFSRELRFKGDDGRDYPEWEEKKLGDLGKFYRGHSYNAGDVNEDGLLVLRSNNIQDNTITFDTDLQFVRKQCKDEIKLREKDIVICMANGSRNLVGKSGEFNNSNGYNDLTVGAFCSIYRTKNPLGKYLLQIELYYKYLDILLSGTNINNLKNSQLEELQFNIPTSNEETEKIVKILSDIDLKIKKEQEKLYYLNEYKKGLLQHMFV